MIFFAGVYDGGKTRLEKPYGIASNKSFRIFPKDLFEAIPKA